MPMPIMIPLQREIEIEGENYIRKFKKVSNYICTIFTSISSLVNIKLFFFLNIYFNYFILFYNRILVTFKLENFLYIRKVIQQRSSQSADQLLNSAKSLKIQSLFIIIFFLISIKCCSLFLQLNLDIKF